MNWRVVGWATGAAAVAWLFWPRKAEAEDMWSTAKASPHFSWREVDPTGLSANRPDVANNLAAAAAKAERLRARVSAFVGREVPLSVTPHGGYDPPEGFADGYHRSSPTSQHHFGRALDIATPAELTDAQFHAIAKAQHAEEGGGLGIYNGFVHIDVRPQVAFWKDSDVANA